MPTSGDYELNIESLLHEHLHKILMTQPPTPPNEHKSHNWTQSLNYMVMHQSNPTAPILYVLIVIQWSIQSLCLWNLNSTSNSPVAPHRLSCQFSANQQEAETSANVNKHWKTCAKSNDVIIYLYEMSSLPISILHRDIVASSPSFSGPAARVAWRACSQAIWTGDQEICVISMTLWDNLAQLAYNYVN